MSTIKNQTDISSLLGEATSIRKVNGRVVIKNRPQRKVTDMTPKQVAANDKFKEALQWVREQMKKADVKASYATRITSKMKSAFVVAMTDYLTSPKVAFIESKNYKGAVGDVITAKATDDFLVTEVDVIIADAAGNILEQGKGAPDPDKGFLWNYTTTVANPALAGTKISVTAFDRPGNATTLEKVL